MKKLFYLLAIVLFTAFGLGAQNYSGSINTNFNTSDKGYSYSTPVGGDIWDIVKLPDGRVLIFGAQGYYSNGLGPMRLPNGDADTTFNNNLAAAGVSGTGGLLLNNGQIFIYGAGIKKVNPDGTLDTTFNCYPMTGEIKTIALQPNGKLIVGGNMYSSGASYGRIIRLNADGSRDNTFQSVATMFDAVVNKVVIQSTGKIIAVGEFTKYFGNVQNRIIRLDTLGNRDITYDVNGSSKGFYNAQVKNLYQLGDTVIAVGKFSQFNGVTRGGVCRILPNGTNDATFANPAIAQTVMDIDRNADGSYIIIEGNGSPGGDLYVYVKKMSANGVIDPAFHANQGFQRYAYGRGVAILPNGKIIAIGQFNKFNLEGVGSIVQINPDGTRDDNYPASTSLDNFVSKVIALPNGKFLVSGTFSRYYNTVVSCLVRLHADGSLDNTFNPGGFGVGTANAGAVPRIVYMDTLANGAIVISGNFTHYNGQEVPPLIKLDANGNLDTTFTYASTDIDRPLLALPNSKVMLYSGSNTQFKILNADGSVDAAFTADSDASGLSSIAIQSDGKIICVGNIAAPGEFLKDMNVLRLNTDGTRDMAFGIPYLFLSDLNYSFSTCAALSNGKVMVAGNYNIPTMSSKYIMRLNANGTIDATFNAGGTGFNSSAIHGIKEQADGKILVWGTFTTYNGQPANGMARLMPDGSLDNSFYISGIAKIPSTITPIGNWTPKIITGVSIAPDASIIVGGSFTEFDGVGRNRISLSKNLMLFSPIVPNDTLCINTTYTITAHTFGALDANNTYTVELSNNLGSFANPTVIGSLQSNNDTVNITCTLPLNIPFGTQYRIRFTTSNLTGISVDNGSNLTVITQVAAPAAFTVASSQVCQNQQGVVYTVPAVPGCTYQWYYPDTATALSSTINSTTIDFSNIAGSVYVRQVNACNIKSPFLVLPVTIKILPVLPAQFDVFNDAVLSGDTNVLYSIAYDSAYTYTWTYSGMGVTITDSIPASVVLDFDTSATSGVLTVIASDSCGTSSPLTLDIIVDGIPLMPEDFTDSQDTVYWGDTGVNYTIPDERSNDVQSYQWTFSGNVAIINGSGASITMDFPVNSTSGVLSVSAVNQWGVSLARTMYINVIETVGINTQLFDNIRIINYNSTIIIEAKNNMVLSIFDMHGRRLMDKNIVAGINTLDINPTAGIYLLRLQKGNQVYTRKMLLGSTY